MTYLYNNWYAAAWSEELTDNMIARTFLDIPVVLYRHKGTVIALHDQCPHRFAPLSRGEVIDGDIRCGYHGLTFNASGKCIKSLFSDTAPNTVKVRQFPVFEQDKMIWIWMGDLPAGDTSAIRRLPFHTDPDVPCVFGYTNAKAGYLLLSDNLMDLSHTALLHPSFGGLDYLPKIKTWEEDDAVFAQFLIEHMPSFFNPGSGELLQENDIIRWTSPATFFLDSKIALNDGAGPVILIPSAHILTPETKKSTNYFWSSAAPGSTEDTLDHARQTLIQAFDHEDKPMIEAVQQRMGDADLWDMDPILLNMDAGSVRVRRKLASLIAQQQEQAL